MIQTQGGIINRENLPWRICGYPEKQDETDPEEIGMEAYLKRMSGRIEKEIILRTLDKCENNRSRTAEKLKITRKTLFNKMKEYGLL
jgi:DNA-binding NtrC family response regulator